MLLVYKFAALALLALACGADDISHRFYFPSMNLLLDTQDAKLGSGHGRRVSSTSGEAPEGGSTSSSGSSSAQAEGGAVVDTPASPSPAAPERPKIREPSRCAFAIVGCCRAGSMRVNDQCFEQFQCHGPFWGESPCRTESAVAAHNIVSKYYDAKEAEKRAQEAEAAAAHAPAAPEAGAPAPEASSPFEPIGPLPSREDASPFEPIGPLPSREDAMNHGTRDGS